MTSQKWTPRKWRSMLQNDLCFKKHCKLLSACSKRTKRWWWQFLNGHLVGLIPTPRTLKPENSKSLMSIKTDICWMDIVWGFSIIVLSNFTQTFTFYRLRCKYNWCWASHCESWLKDVPVENNCSLNKTLLVEQLTMVKPTTDKAENSDFLRWLWLYRWVRWWSGLHWWDLTRLKLELLIIYINRMFI